MQEDSFLCLIDQANLVASLQPAYHQVYGYNPKCSYWTASFIEQNWPYIQGNMPKIALTVQLQVLFSFLSHPDLQFHFAAGVMEVTTEEQDNQP